jgi:preprotein translocase subunit SecG
MLVLALLFEILLQENGSAGIGDKSARGRQENIARAILDFNSAPKKG